jgi:hypothetical protein
MMASQKRKLLLLLLGIVFLAGLGYYFYSEMRGGSEGLLRAKRPATDEGKLSSGEKPGSVKEEAGPGQVVREKIALRPYAEEPDCKQIEEDVEAFFQYLDQKKFVQHLGSGTDAYARFKRIIKRLAADPPIPAGEGIDPRIIIQNVYYLYRILDRTDIRLIKDVVVNEKDIMELNLHMFYKWLTLGGRCPDNEGLRPSLKALYHYAGFFLNTIGGRAYLFRRSEGLRLLVSYYSVLIVHEADKQGKNYYGIDVFPFIDPLKQEISYYPNFEFQNEYIDQLNKMEDYYLQRR